MTKGYLFHILRHERFYIIAGLGIAIPLVFSNISFLMEQINTTFDDAYMFVRYAVNFLNGYGFAWNPDGIQTYGVTSILYLLFIIIVRWLFPLVDAGAILSVSSFILGMFVPVAIALGCMQITTSEFFKKYRYLFPLFTTIILMLSSHYQLHMVSGMDTTLSILCNTLLIIATIGWVKKTTRFSLTLVVIASYASFLARPDSFIYAVLFPILYGWFFLRDARTKMIVWFCLAIATMLLLDILVKYWIFGDPLPLPFYTKRAGYLDGYRDIFMWNPTSYLIIFFREMFPFIAILFLGTTAKSWRLILIFLTPVILTFAYFFSFTQIMGFWARYYFPALPFFVMGSFMVLDQRLLNTTPNFKRNLTMHNILTLFAAIILFLPISKSTIETAYENRFMSSPRIYKSSISHDIDSDFPKLGWWTSINVMSELISQLPAGTRVAMSEYGLVGAKSPEIYIIDLIGLHDPFFAHNGFVSSELFERHPDIIWLPPPAYTKILASIQDDPKLLTEYNYYPGAFDNGLAVRREAKQYKLIMKIISNTWLKYYPDVEMERYPYK
jgi:hypothetical protein